MPDPSRLIRLGVFGAAQGVRGEARVNSATANPADIAAYGPLSDRSGARRFELQFVRALKDTMIVARVKGVTTRDEAEALTGVELFARRDQLPPPADGEYYHTDLIGLTAIDEGGEPIGSVVGVLNYGAGDILEIQPSAGGETVLLPFSDDVARVVDFEAERIVIRPPQEVDT